MIDREGWRELARHCIAVAAIGTTILILITILLVIIKTLELST